MLVDVTLLLCVAAHPAAPASVAPAAIAHAPGSGAPAGAGAAAAACACAGDAAAAAGGGGGGAAAAAAAAAAMRLVLCLPPSRAPYLAHRHLLVLVELWAFLLVLAWVLESASQGATRSR